MSHSQADILVVESDPILHALLRMAFQRAGYSARFASRGEQALSLLKEQPPHLVLLDLHLAQENGLDLLKRLKGDRLLRDIDVIMVSALGFREIVQEAVQAGASDFLVKPFLVDDLLRRVQRVLGHAKIKPLSAGLPKT